MITMRDFKSLNTSMQLNYLLAAGITMDLACTRKGKNAILYALHDFYVEVLVEKHTELLCEILCFRSFSRLEPYLRGVNIDEIKTLVYPGWNCSQ